MSKKGFWNWFGLPSFPDIVHLLEELHKQQHQIAQLEKANAELSQQLLDVENRLAATVKVTEQQTQTVFAATAQHLTQQSENLAKNIADVNQNVQSADRRFEKSQTVLSDQLKSVEEALSKGQDEVKQAFADSSMAEQMKKISIDLTEVGKAVHNSVDSLDEKTKHLAETLSSVKTEVHSVNMTVDSFNRIEGDQNELLRMLLVNSLSDNINQMIDSAQGKK